MALHVLHENNSVTRVETLCAGELDTKCKNILRQIYPFIHPVLAEDINVVTVYLSFRSHFKCKNFGFSQLFSLLQALEAPFMMTNSSVDKELLPSPYDPK